MNVEASVLVALGTLAFVIGIRLIYNEVCGFSSRAPNDVFPFLFKIDMEALNGTFHPEVEDRFRVQPAVAGVQAGPVETHPPGHSLLQSDLEQCARLSWLDAP